MGIDPDQLQDDLKIIAEGLALSGATQETIETFINHLIKGLQAGQTSPQDIHHMAAPTREQLNRPGGRELLLAQARDRVQRDKEASIRSEEIRPNIIKAVLTMMLYGLIVLLIWRPSTLPMQLGCLVGWLAYVGVLSRWMWSIRVAERTAQGLRMNSLTDGRVVLLQPLLLPLWLLQDLFNR